MLRMVPLRLVHAVEPPIATYPIPAVLEDWQNEQARRIVRDAADTAPRIAKEAGATAHFVGTEIYSARAIPTLVDLSKDSEMAVLGSRGSGAFRRGLLGSVSTALVHHAHCPVAVVRDSITPPTHSVRVPLIVARQS